MFQFMICLVYKLISVYRAYIVKNEAYSLRENIRTLVTVFLSLTVIYSTGWLVSQSSPSHTSN